MFEILWTFLIYPRSFLRSQHELAMEVLALRHQNHGAQAASAQAEAGPLGPVCLDDTQEGLAELESSVDNLPA